MKKYILLLLFLLPFFSYSQKKTVYGDLKASDSTELNIIKISPDSFPAISIIFEALKKDEPVFGLSEDHLIVSEDNKLCKIISLTEIDNDYSINISLIIDHSGSMQSDSWQLYDTITGKPLYTYTYKDGRYFYNYPEGYVAPIDNAKKAVSEFIGEIKTGKDSIQIIGFSTQVDIWSSFSSDKKYLQSVVDSMKSDYSTAFLDAINFSLDSIKSHSGIKVIVALTDGLDNSSHVTIKEIIKKSRELKVPVYTIGLGDVDRKFLSDISKKTGGAFYYTKNSNSLSRIYEEIRERIHSIYDLRYISENLDPNDTLRKIKIEFKVDSLYLANNMEDLKISEKVINYLNDKKGKGKYMAYGVGITATMAGAGIIFFIYRRRKKKKEEKA